MLKVDVYHWKALYKRPLDSLPRTSRSQLASVTVTVTVDSYVHDANLSRPIEDADRPSILEGVCVSIDHSFRNHVKAGPIIFQSAPSVRFERMRISPWKSCWRAQSVKMNECWRLECWITRTYVQELTCRAFHLQVVCVEARCLRTIGKRCT